MRFTKQAQCSLRMLTTAVWAGLKDAYLVDCCFLPQKDANAYIQNFIQQVGGGGEVHAGRCSLGVVGLGTDVFFVNMTYWRKKLLLWAQGLVEHVMFVDLTGDSPCLASEELTGEILSALQDFAVQTASSSAGSSSVYSLSINFEDHIYKRLGGPCLAGLLLGYPLVYFLPGTGEDVFARGCHMLSHITLLKFTSEVFIQPTDRPAKSGFWRYFSEFATSNSVSLRLHEFTVPASLFPRSDGVNWCEEELLLEEKRVQALDFFAGCSLSCSVECVSFVSDNVTL